MGAIGGLSTSSPSGLTTPATALLAIALGNTEQAFTFPALTKFFRIFNDGAYCAKLSYQAGESASNYIPIYPGDSLELYGIIATSVTIYLQSPGQINLHLEYWT